MAICAACVSWKWKLFGHLMNVPSAYDAGGYTKLIDGKGVPPHRAG